MVVKLECLRAMIEISILRLSNLPGLPYTRLIMIVEGRSGGLIK